MEEARLIYSGVAHTMPSEPGKRLVVDIGGGSTELIIGEGLTPLELESLQMGCVSLSERFFRDGKISAKRIERARLAARLELEPVQAAFRRRGWERCAGSSGTVRAIGEAIRELDPQQLTITAGGARARARVLRRGRPHPRAATSAPITEDRRPVFPGGTGDPRGDVRRARHRGDADRRRRDARGPAVRHASAATSDEDARERTVRAMQQRYHVDIAQAERVEATVLDFLEQTRETWKLEEPLARPGVKWAARLHEIGLDVSHSGYHRHGAYLLENADMPGFPREEQRLLARLVGAPPPQVCPASAGGARAAVGRSAVHLIVLLRLAVLLHRGQDPSALPPIVLTPAYRSLEMNFPRGG